MEKTTLYLPQGLRRALRAEGKRARRPQAELIREALERYLGERPRATPRSVGIASDGRTSGRESEAWIRRQWDRR